MLANWTQPFSTANTIKSFPFLLSKGTTVHVPMMQQTELFAFGVDRELGCTVLQLDYRGDAVAFFILPGKGKMWELEKSLSARRLRKWSRSLQKRYMFAMSCSSKDGLVEGGECGSGYSVIIVCQASNACQTVNLELWPHSAK